MAGIDVVIPNYQYGRYLRGCVTSVLSQGIEDVRVLIIDNASTDDSVDVARQLAAEDSRVEVLARKTNLGPHASFNEGIDWARAEYFLILCSDDQLAPGALKRAAAVMARRADVHLTLGATLTIAADAAAPRAQPALRETRWRIVRGLDFIDRLCRSGRNPVPGPSAIVRTSVQKKVGYYRPALPHTDDLEMWLRFGCAGDIAQTDAVQALARTHVLNQSATVSDIDHWNRQFEAAFESFFDHEGAVLRDAARLRKQARHSLAERSYWGAWSHLFRGEPALSIRLVKSALRLCPWMAVLPPLDYVVRRSGILGPTRAQIASGGAI